jgi:hypothetical protein
MGIESVLFKFFLAGAFILGLILIIPTKREKTYMLRGKVLTLRQIAELLCEDGVFICQHNDEVQMAYDHDVEAIPAVLEILAEAEMPAEVFNETSILVKDPVVYGGL